MESGSIWSDSPVLLVLTPFFLFIGLWLLGETKAETDKSVIAGVRRRMILVYLVATLGLVMIILFVHELSDEVPPPPGKSYGPVIVLLALLSYAACYWFFIRKGDYKDRSPLLMPFFFLAGAMMAPIDAVDIYNVFSQRVEIVESGKDIENAQSDFIKFDNLELDRNRVLVWWWDHHDKKDSCNVEYRGLIPVITQPGDTLYHVWVDFIKYRTFARFSPDSTQQKEEFEHRYHEVISHFSPGNVAFFDHSARDGMKVLKASEYPSREPLIFLQPHHEPLSSYQTMKSGLYNKVGLFLFISLAFWLISSGKLDREGYTWGSRNRK
jgi:hypothetical protein